MSELLIALLLGVVEGLTEFLPVSSTGHLILAGNLLGYTGPQAATFEVFIQLGAILAVIVMYRRRFADLFRRQPSNVLTGTSGLVRLGLTTLPAVVAGFLLHGFIKERLFTPITVATGLLAGGIVIILVERFYRPADEQELDRLSWRQAWYIGLFQLFALSPGVSRAGATIIGGRLLGLSRGAALEYSFLAAVPLMAAAVSYDLIRSLPMLSPGDILPFAVGFMTAFMSALLAIKFFIGLVKRYTLMPFGWYRICLGLLILFMTLN